MEREARKKERGTDAGNQEDDDDEFCGVEYVSSKMKFEDEEAMSELPQFVTVPTVFPGGAGASALLRF